MTKTEQIKELLEENRKVLLNGEMNNGICFDGIVDENTYNKQKIKVMVLLKETNGNDDEGNNIDTHSDWDYLYWLKHQQADNEPEKKIKNGKEYEETNVFYHHTYKKLCHWLCMLFDVIEKGNTNPETYLKNGKVDIEKVRKVLNRVAVVNLKKTWGTASTNSNNLWNYAIDNHIVDILEEQFKIISPDVVLCCSTDVFNIIKHIKNRHEDGFRSSWGIGFGESKTFPERGVRYFMREGTLYIDFIHPQWYGKKEIVLADYAKETFERIIGHYRMLGEEHNCTFGKKFL